MREHFYHFSLTPAKKAVILPQQYEFQKPFRRWASLAVRDRGGIRGSVRSISPPQQLFAQTVTATSTLVPGYVPAASTGMMNGIADSLMTIDPTTGNILGVGSLTGSGALTGSSLSTILTAASPPLSAGQGLVTVLVQNNATSAPTQNGLACRPRTRRLGARPPHLTQLYFELEKI